MMDVRPIRTKRDYERALKRVEELWGAEVGTAEGDELDVLATLVDSYESQHFPIPAPDAISAIKFRLEQMGLKQADLAAIVGGSNRASEIMRGKRKLTVKMIKSLHEKLDIPVESLINAG